MNLVPNQQHALHAQLSVAWGQVIILTPYVETTDQPRKQSLAPLIYANANLYWI